MAFTIPRVKTGISTGHGPSTSGMRGTTIKPPTMRIPSQRRDYSKAAQGVEQPVKNQSPTFGANIMGSLPK